MYRENYSEQFPEEEDTAKQKLRSVYGAWYHTRSHEQDLFLWMEHRATIGISSAFEDAKEQPE